MREQCEVCCDCGICVPDLLRMLEPDYRRLYEVRSLDDDRRVLAISHSTDSLQQRHLLAIHEE